MAKVLFPFTIWRKIMLFGDPVLKNNFISSIVKGHLDTKKYSFLINIPFTIWRKSCHFDGGCSKKIFIPSLYGEICALLTGVKKGFLFPFH